MPASGPEQTRRARPRRPSRLALAAAAAGLLLLVSGAFGLALTSAAAPAARGSADDRSLDRMVRYLQLVQRPDGCFPMDGGGNADPAYASSWAAIALAAAGVNPREQFRPDGYRSVLDCIRAHVADLHVTTDFERVLLVVNAAGTDPHAFGGVDLVRRILAQQRPDGSFTHDPAKPAPGINTTIWAILSLAPVREPAVTVAIRRAARWILRTQNEDGGWPAVAAGVASSTDMTGAALQALHAAGLLGGARADDAGGSPGGTRTDAAADRARDAALGWLRGVQGGDGGFPDLEGVSSSNSASTAWVAQGVWAVGKDPGRWRRGGRSMLDYLGSLQQRDGSVRWTAQKQMNPVWMTAYTAPAYSGRYLPLAAVPYRGSVPNPGNRPSRADRAGGTGGGSGGSGGDGGGVLIGGGGEGAPVFSRPRQGSKGAAVGGVTRVDSAAEKPAPRPARSQQRQDDDAAAPAPSTPGDDRAAAAPAAPAPTGPAAPQAGGSQPASSAAAAPTGARAPDRSRARAGAGAAAPAGALSAAAARAARDDRADAGDETVSGVVVGGDGAAAAANADSGDPAAAYGLRSASAGGDSGPWLASAIAGALLLFAALGSLLERRRADASAAA